MTYPDVSREARRAVERHGEDVTVYNYTQNGTDDYGDPLWSESSSTAQAVIDFPGGGTSEKGDQGQESVADAIVRLSTANTVHPPTESNPRATEIERGNGERFKVQTAIDENAGLYQCECERLEQ